MRKIYLLLVVCCMNLVARGQGIPLAYWSFENGNFVTPAQSLAVTDQITGNNGAAAGNVTAVGVTTNAVNGAGVYHGGTHTGLGISSTFPAANAQASATGYWQFNLTNTASSTTAGITIQFDATTTVGTGATTYVGLLFSNDGGVTFHAPTVGTNPSILTTGWGPISYTISAALPNINVIRVYTYSNATAVTTIDNVTILCGSTASNVSFTTADENDIYEMTTGGLSGSQVPRSGLNIGGTGTKVTVNNTTAFSGINVNTAFNIQTGDTAIFGSQGIINGTGGFSNTIGSFLFIANPNGIALVGTASGAIQCTAYRTYANTGNYIFNGTVPQVTGTGLPTTITSPAFVTIDNPAGVQLTTTPGTTFANGSTLNLETGIFSFITGTNTLGNSSGSYVNCDNGGLSSTPTVYSGLTLTYMPLGVDNLAFTTGNEWPASFTGTTIVNKPGAVITLNGNKSNTGNITLTAGSLDASVSNYNLALDGNWINNSSPTAFVPRSATMTMFGINATLNVGGTQTTNFNNFTVNMTGTFGSVTNLGNTEYVNGTLTLQAGLLNIGVNDLILGTATPAVAGGPFAQPLIFNYIVATSTGYVEKQMTANGTFLYPIGDASATNDYTPITLNFTGGTYGPGAEAGVNVQNVKDPNNFDVTNYINRYWNVCVNNITSPSYIVSSVFLPNAFGAGGDVTGTYTGIAMGQWTGATPWTLFTNAGTNTLTTTTAVTTTGCSQFTGINNGNPVAAVTASTGICAGGTITLSAAGSTGAATPLTYTWAPASTLSASTGISVVATPTATVTVYTVTVTDANGFSATATTTINANPVPNPITGNAAVCQGFTTSLSSSTAGGTWAASGNVSLTGSTANPITVTGNTAGTGTVTYNLGGGCSIYYIVTVNPNPNNITGVESVCVGLTTTLSTTTAGVSWTTGNGNATVTTGSSTTTVTGVNGSTTDVITATIPATGCYASATVTINPNPVAITGLETVCVGTTTSLSTTTAGVNWTASNGDATVTTGSSTTTVTGVTGSTTDIITATIPGTGCLTTATVTINPNPVAITGVKAVCVGLTTSLSTTTAGVSWTASNGNATVTTGSSTTTVTGVNGSTTDVITATIPATGCLTTATVTINPNPAPITGTETVCVGLTTSLSTTTAGVSWTASNGDATYTTTGGSTTTVTGVTGNTTDIITATIPGTGCLASATVTINPNPTPITGVEAVCVGLTTSLSTTTAGVSWTASNGNATYTTTGGSTTTVTGVTGGTTDIITATIPATGCLASATVTINANPAPITGVEAVCVGLTTTLSTTTGGVSWTAGNGNATVTTGSSTTTVTGVNGSTTDIITATIPATGCLASATVTINPNPAPITGVEAVCVGLTTSLSTTTAGVNWTAGNGNATITTGSSTTTVTGVNGSTTDIITATIPATGCLATATVTINPNPAPITGVEAVCVGLTTSLSTTTAGVSWTAANGNATVTTGSSTTVVTGVNGSTTDLITATIPATGCLATATVTINPNPAPITGVEAVCVGLTTSLSTTTAGVNWTAGNGNATVTTGSSTTTVTGVTGGTTDIITATIPGTGCKATATVTINANPAAITGVMNVCQGLTTSLSSTTLGGTWSSNNGDAAPGTTASNTTVVTGNTVGVSMITYDVIATGCITTTNVTVNTQPTGITGTNLVCVLSTTTLNSTPAGGTWSSSNTTIGTVGSTTGIVYGVAQGSTTITYTLSDGCFTTIGVTVNPIPTPITASPGFSVCAGLTTTLSSTPPGGAWSIVDFPLGDASISATGVVTGVNAGTATVTYFGGASCYVTATVTINTQPAAITGTQSVCVGLVTSLTDATTGGTWATTAPHATIDGSGDVSGSSAGTSIVTYTLSDGCFSNAIVTVNPNPNAITGVESVCVGLTTSLSTTTAGVSWTAGNGNATVTTGSSTTTVTGVNGSTTDVITATIPATGCLATATVTINPNPAPITGTETVCVGLTTSLSTTTAGVSWTAGNGNATVTTGSSTTTVTGVNGSTTDVITATIPATGCLATATVTINPNPAPITGVKAVCVGLTTSLSTTTAGVNWTAGNGNATVTTGSSTTTVTGVTGGTTDIITATIPATGCLATATVTINANPAPITGVEAVCVGLTTTLSTTTGGVSWTAGNGNATVTTGSSTTTVTGVNGSTTDIITATIPATGCLASATVTINPNPAPITGVETVCVGLTTSLSTTTAGVNWTAGNGNATVTTGSSTTTVTGVNGSTTDLITATIPATGCLATATVTINPNPAPITGVEAVCVGATTTLSTTTAGVSWTAGNGNATVTTGSSTTTVTGVNGSTTDLITATIPATGCLATATVTINPNPAPITGVEAVCVGLNTTLSTTSAGITWTASNGNATYTTTGGSTTTVTGVTGSTTDIITASFTATGCHVSATVTINPNPTIITGSLNVCVGLNTTLNSTPAGGTWSSSNTAVGSFATSTTGVLTGVSAGTTIVTYTLSTGCINTTIVTVNGDPTAITASPSFAVCVGLTTTMNSTPGGGTWSASGTAVSINSSTGVVTGLNAGTAAITYTLGTGCSNPTSAIVTVNPNPTNITGSSSVCVGLTTTLNSTPAGGTWSSTNTAIGSFATSTTGVVTGVSQGTTTIIYALPTGCVNVAPFVLTVNPNPSTITSTPICAGSTATLNSTPAGGTWSSSNTLNASVGSLTGVVTGGAGGTTATIIYELPTTCISSTVITVNITPAAITGTDAVCIGLTTQLSTLPTGGTWTTTNGDAGVNSITGLVQGYDTTTYGGIDTVIYTLATGCHNSVVVTVNPDPANIGGNLTVCVGSTTTLNTTPAGGTWSSSNPGVGSFAVSTTGVLTGVSAGTTTVTYKLSTGCLTTVVVTVNANPAPITGADSVCVGLTTTLNSTTAGGTWQAGNTNIIVGSTGIVSGSFAGTSGITYTIPATGCISTAVVTVNPNPTAIQGIDSICVGLTTTLSSTPGGGTWSSSNTHAFTTGTTGIVTGVSFGTSVITYTLITGCINTAVVTVNPLPLPITGADSVCVGLTTALTDAGGGTWSAGNGNATVGSTGIVYGNIAGTDEITYTLITGCISTVTVTINPNPVAVSGVLKVCSGLTTSLSDGTSGGTWSSSNTTVAQIGTYTGVVTGGNVTVPTTVTITYTLPTGCLITAVVTVNPLPNAITGTLSVCQGLTTTLADAGGGTWSLSNGNASILGFVVTGHTAGLDTVTYTLPTGCTAEAVVTVDALPSAISGNLLLCPGITSQLSDTAADGTGTWSGGTTGIATISSTGVVTADTVLTTGTTTVTYTVPTGCIITAVVTVNPLPTAILGNLNVCSGLTTSLFDATAGGTWSTASTGGATVNSTTGLVTGGIVGAGTTDTATVIYTITSTGCTAVAVVTVDPIPSNVFGTLTVCVGLTTPLFDTTAGGTWSSSNTTVATVDASTGLVTGVSNGTSTIIYTLPTGCVATAVVTVNPLPGTINGTLIFCAGVTSVLTDAITGGTWSTSDIYTATIGLTDGALFGWSGGTVVVTYTLPSSCYITTIATVEPLPGAILGDLQVCQGLTTQLSDLTPGGTWSINPPTTVAGISGGGLVTGDLAGTATVSYTLPTGCGSSAIVTVNPLPANISGTPAVCLGLTTALTDASTGGTWSSSDPGIASVDSLTGIVTGIDTGIATITYTLPTGCIITTVVTVNPLPSPISGSLAVCVGLNTSLSDAGAGSWGMSNGNATIDPSTGYVTGISAGLDTVTYTLPTGCIINATVTVYALPSAIYGNLAVCAGLTTALNDTPTGGTWSLSNGNATIDSLTGMVTGGAVSVTSYDTVTYNLATGCTATGFVTVNPVPTAINGIMIVCIGHNTQLSDASAGGTWSSSNTNVNIGSISGLATGENAGTSTITYTLPTGCIATAVVTVTGLPGRILGDSTVCLFSTISLSDNSLGGVWTTGNSSIATIGSTGIVYGAGVGTASISYTLSAGCVVSAVVTVDPLPNVYSLTPTSGSYCDGGAGVDLMLTGSDVGVSYLLYYDSSVTGFKAGTGDSINFGNEFIQGTYTVRATSSATGCSIGMIGSSYITINPTVNPLVTIVSLAGDTVCPGTAVTFTLSTTYAGASPTYQWFVNHVLVGVSSTYTFIPANGDVVSVILTSDGACVMPNTATDSLKMVVPLDGNPQVSLSIFPGDTVCQYGVATFYANATYGGPTPTFTWYVNGTAVGTGPSYTYIPTTGDNVYCTMVSDYRCRTTTTVNSTTVTMTVTQMLIPHVEITSSRGFVISVGEYDTLTTTVLNAGTDPSYQWEINGVPVPGAIYPTFISQFNNYDSVTCVVTSNGFCDGVSSFDWVFITVYPAGVQQYTLGNGDIRLIPNPNKGAFTVTGTLGGAVAGIDEEVSLEITDMLGQVIYRNKVMVQNGKINEQIRLNNSLANGMYLLNVKSGSSSKAFHFVVEQ